MSPDQVNTLRPGDNIRWDIEFYSQGRVDKVQAFFLATLDGEDHYIFLEGEVNDFTLTDKGRLNEASLYLDEDGSTKPLERLDYRLNDIRCIARGRLHFFDNDALPQGVTIRFEDNPISGEENLRLGETHFRIL